MKHLTNECPAEKGTLRIMNVRFLRQALLASFSVSWVLPVLYSGIANATAIDFQPGSQPAGPTSGADTGQDWVLILVLAALACGIVAIVLWELWGYFSAASGGRSPPGSLSPVIEAVSPPYPVHLRASRLKDSSLPIIEGVSPASPNVTAPRSETTPVHAYFILQNDQPEGPYSIEELRSLWNSGVLAGETFYCEEGYDEWLRLEKIADQLEPPPLGPLPPTPQTQNAAPTPVAPKAEVLSRRSIPHSAASTESPARASDKRADSPLSRPAEPLRYPVRDGEISESKLKSGFGIAIRWILVLPAATLGFLFGSIIFSTYFNPYAELFPELIRSILTSCIQGALFVVAGANAAPSHRFIVALSLTVLHAVFLSYFVFASHMPLAIAGVAIGVAPAIITTICVCAAFRKEES